MTFIKNQMHPSSNARLFIDSNYWKWHQLYRKSNTNKSTEQLEIKSRLKMEGVVCSCQPESHSKMLRRWGNGQVQPAKPDLRNLSKLSARWSLISMFLSAPCGGWTGFWWWTDAFWSVGVVFGIASSNELSTSVVTTLLRGAVSSPSFCFLSLRAVHPAFVPA